MPRIRRRSAAALVAVLVAAGVAGAAPARAAAAATRWAQDGYGAGNTGYNPDEPVVNPDTIAALARRWTVTAAPGPEGCQQAPVAPLVVDGRMFVLDSGGVGAYDVRTGRRLWLYTAGYLEATGLVVVGGLVIVTDVNCWSNSSYDSNVIALDARTGAERWNRLSSWTTSTVVADAGVVVVSGYCGTCDDAEYGVDAYRASDGTPLWRRTNAVLAGPVAAGGRVLLSGTDAPGLSAVTITTGSPLWTTRTASVARAANPAGDQFYLTNAAGLRAVNAATGRLVWQVGTETGDRGLASDGRRVYVAAATRIRAYDARSGTLRWTRAVSGPGRPIRAGGLLYTVTDSGTLTVLAPTDGRPVAAAGTGSGLGNHVVVAGGMLYAASGPSVRAYAPRSYRR